MDDLQLIAEAQLPNAGEEPANFLERCPPGSIVVAALGCGRDATWWPALTDVAAAWTSLWDGHDSMLHFAADRGLTVGGWMFEVAEAQMLDTWSAVLHELLGRAQMGAFAAAFPVSETHCCTVRVGTYDWTDKAEVDHVLQQLRRLGIASAAEYMVYTCTRVGETAQPDKMVVWKAAPNCTVSIRCSLLTNQQAALVRQQATKLHSALQSVVTCTLGMHLAVPPPPSWHKDVDRKFGLTEIYLCRRDLLRILNQRTYVTEQVAEYFMATPLCYKDSTEPPPPTCLFINNAHSIPLDGCSESFLEVWSEASAALWISTDPFFNFKRRNTSSLPAICRSVLLGLVERMCRKQGLCRSTTGLASLETGLASLAVFSACAPRGKDTLVPPP
jgi:hypothetical protein